MIDFSALKGMEIPEGKVKSILITESDGTAYEVGFAEMVKVAITGSSYYSGEADATVTIDGIVYAYPGTLEVPIGTVITCYVEDDYYSESKEGTKSYIKVNGTTVSGTDNKTYTYLYTVTSDTVITLGYGSKYSSQKGETLYYGTIKITEIPEGHALVTITGMGDANYSYVTIDGVGYTGAAAVAVPIGTTIYCCAGYSIKNNHPRAYITLNDVEIGTETNMGTSAKVEYYHTVTGDVSIWLQSYNGMDSAHISITEQ